MMKIKKIITAIGVNSLSTKLKEKEGIEVVGNDIPYQDGVLDVLKGNSEINLLILNENLIGEYEIKDFVDKIFEINQDLEIIFLMEKENLTLKNFLEKRGVSKIFIDGELELQEIIEKILEENFNTDLSLEIEKLKQIIKIERNPKDKGLKIEKKSNIDRVTAITGNYGSGKSLITALFGKAAKKCNIKTVIIDFDIINHSINTIFRVQKHNLYENKEDIESFITHVSTNLDVICGIDALFTEENKISYQKVEKLILDLKDIYDLILIDTSSETTLKFIKVVLANVDKVIFLLEPNLLEIKKAENLLEVYMEDWEISPKKIGILLNKVNNHSVDETILKEIFGRFKILGKINFSTKFTSLANDIRRENIGLEKYIKILEKAK